ncbi:hypothetical protein FH972_021802 [Carpinus fangiana]|uniref:Uncharacterized protein n=1 Tax=Carpinus fangiana TaxID=176857 RepID=A0A5N6KQR1_9ROSI|nr:hypothetical protein FH972_021802 [Carpinus fangiana]
MEHTHEQNRISSLNPRAGRRSQDSLIFIPVENPMYRNQNPSSRFAIRSHVAKQTRLTQCRQQAERQQNYRNTTPINFRQAKSPHVDRSSRSLCEHDEAEATTIPPPVGPFEPFGCFPVSVSYLATLLYDKPARGIGILCLVTVEHRLGNRLTVEKHMSGINQILEIRKSTSIPLPGGLKRALFWQDLFAAMFMGTTRLFQYDTFFEMQRMKDQLPVTFSKLPSGFENNRDMLTPELVSVVEDLGAFTLYVDEGDETGNRSDLMFRTRVGYQQAGIESRLVNIQSERHALDLITSSRLSGCERTCPEEKVSGTLFSGELQTDLLVRCYGL